MDKTLDYLRAEGFCSSAIEGVDPISKEGLESMSREELVAYIQALHSEIKRLNEQIVDIRIFNAEAINIAADIETKYESLRSAIRNASAVA